MYKAIYKFLGSSPDCLSFEEGDRFTLVDDKLAAWWIVHDGKGQIGYVPSNYLAPDDSDMSEVLKSIDRAVETIQQQAKLSGGQLTPEQQANLRKLQNHRKDFVEKSRREKTSSVHLRKLNSDKPRSGQESRDIKIHRQAPLPPNPSKESSQYPAATNTGSSLRNAEADVGIKNAEAAEHRDQARLKASDSRTEPNGSVEPRISSVSCSDQEQELNLDGVGSELVEEMRKSTLLSFEKSKVAVSTVLVLLVKRIPSIGGVIHKVLDDITRDQQSPTLEMSSDAARLRCIIDELVAAKDDSQQRSWFLHEDEEKICAHLEELNSILEGANPETSRKVIRQDGFNVCQNLAQYYQMEMRRSIRLLLLQSFGSMCALDPCIVSELLNSILPLELARDILHDQTDKQKLIYSALVLSMLFSTAEALPLQYYVHLDVNFVNVLLETIESSDEDAEHEEVIDGFMRLILAFNLHFELPEENIVMKAFAARGTAKNFTEKLLLLFNREDDPVHLFDHSKNCPNSVIKFVADLFSRSDTSNLFYTNDAKVLIDIIVRQLTDLSAGDKMRTEYLSLMHLLLKNSDYGEHKHRQAELQLLFQRISQDDGEAEMDKHIIQQIWKEFPESFYNSI